MHKNTISRGYLAASYSPDPDRPADLTPGARSFLDLPVAGGKDAVAAALPAGTDPALIEEEVAAFVDEHVAPLVPAVWLPRLGEKP